MKEHMKTHFLLCPLSYPAATGAGLEPATRKSEVRVFLTIHAKENAEEHAKTVAGIMPGTVVSKERSSSPSACFMLY